MVSKDNYQLLIEKLDQFTRKYYANQMIRGSLYSVGLILALFLFVSLLEHQFFFGKGMRKFMFYSFLGTSLIALVYWVFTPMVHYFRLGKLISHEQAAEIIGNHFSNVKDKLLNVLQLKQQADQNAEQAALILASINQKTEEIKPVPFKAAIDFNQNRKYLRYALPPLLLLIVLLFAAPSLIKDSTSRLINNNKEFEKDAPFSFVIDEEELSVIQFSDYILTVQVEGDLLPNEVYIDIDNYQYRLNKKSNNEFTYQFSNVQKDTDFSLFSSGVKSGEYTLGVLKKPNILGFEVKLDYPNYTKRKDESLQNIGDLVVPNGTKINWVFNAAYTKDILLKFTSEEDLINADRFDNELFSYQKQAFNDDSYKLYVSNEFLPLADSVSYSLNVIPDLYPTIRVDQFVDSTESKLLYFVGDAADDYGLLSLSFNWFIEKENGTKGDLNTVKMKKPDANKVQYDYVWDLNNITLKPGDEVVYYFEVYDNDAVNGSKPARTNPLIYKVPTLEEMEELAEENTEAAKDNIEKSLEEARKLQQDMKKLREKLLQEKEVDWQTRKELEKLMERQKELEEQLREAKEKFEENMQNQQEMEEKPSEEIQEKQEKVQEMFEEVLSEEMKELMEQIEELMEKLEKDGALEMMEEMEAEDQEMEMELDRMLEMLKQLEVEHALEQQMKKLEELAEEQEQLSEETEAGEKSNEELEQQQEELNQKFDKLQEKMEEVEEKNNELERPKDMGDNDQKMDDIKQDMNKSQEQLQQQQNSKASESQKNAAKKMKEMAQEMQQKMQSGEMEQMQEDMESLRQLLENLVNLSFEQEDLIRDFNNVNTNTPRYVELVQNQYKLKDDFRLIEDTLQELSKRVFQIEAFVTEKVSEVKRHFKEGLEELEERKKMQAADDQQRIMKNVNDLALMLSEVMQQMQQQMANQMSGSQMCNKPGSQGQKGSVPMDKITKGQQELNEQMKQMQQQQKGKNGEGGQGGTSKEFAEMAAKQAALRKALKEKAQEKQQQGKGDKGLQQLIEEMDQVETDLVNKQLTNEMIKRQQDILTRLLEAEKAEREREYDNKRKAEVASEKERQIPPSLEEYIRKRESEIEMYKSVSPTLKPYYKYLVEEYFNSLKKQ